MSIIDYFCVFLGGRFLGNPDSLVRVRGKFWGGWKSEFLARWRLHRRNVPRARTSDKSCKGRLNKTYVCMYVCMYVLVSCLQAIVARGN